MINQTVTDTTTNLADKVVSSADQAIRSTQRLANQTLDGLSSSVHQMQDAAVPAINRAAAQVGDFAQRGLDAARDSTQQVRDRASQLSASTVDYIKDEPVKAVLIAAATGAALMALLSMVRRSGH